MKASLLKGSLDAGRWRYGIFQKFFLGDGDWGSPPPQLTSLARLNLGQLGDERGSPGFGRSSPAAISEIAAARLFVQPASSPTAY